MIIDTAIHMERVKILVIRAADEPGEQFAVNSWNTDDKIFLGKSSIKVLHSDYVQVHRESKAIILRIWPEAIILRIWPREDLGWIEVGVRGILGARTKTSHNWKIRQINNKVSY